MSRALPAKTRGDAPAADIRRGAQTVHRAIDILEAFSVDRPSLALSEICDAVNLTLPTTHRLLKALQHKEMVFWDPLSKRYSLGVGVMRLASLILNRNDLTSIIQPSLAFLHAETRETVALHGLVDDERVCLIELVSPMPIRMASGVGTAYPLFSGAAGKAILARLPDERVRSILDAAVKGRHLTPARRVALLRELGEVLSRGYATSRGETVQGAAAIAAPVLDATGVVVGAINITGPADRLTPETAERFVAPLLNIAAHVMRQLGAEQLPHSPNGEPFAREVKRRRTGRAQ